MIRPHHDTTRFLPADGPGIPLDSWCANPFCHELATDRHHVWSKGQMSRPSDWVLDNHTGDMIPNRLPVCRKCHEDVTGRIGGHFAKVQYVPDEKQFYWVELPSFEGAEINHFRPRSVLQLSEWLRSLGRDEDADRLLEAA